MSIGERVARTVRRHRLLPVGSRVLAAVSGGSDSVALLRLLVALQPQLGCGVVGLAHVNHQLRGAASDADERFCRDLAAALGLDAYVERVDVPRGPGHSPEEAARDARYAALERGRVALGADLVALGHTRDDQAETVVLKLLRGAGLRGLGGIHPRRGACVRPLLEIGREELREWLRAGGHAWIEDASNADLSLARNRVRHLVLPALAQASGADVSRALARHAEIARDEDAWVEAQATVAFGRIRQPTEGDGVALDVDRLLVEPLALQRRVLRLALLAAGARQPGYIEVEALRELADGPATSVLLHGPVRAERLGTAGVLVLRRPAVPATALAFSYPLSVPGEVATGAWTLTADLAAPDELLAPDGSAHASIDAGAAHDGLGVRSWRPGDWIRPVGLGGRKKLQDVFVDRKVPREARHRLPLVVDARDQVVWVPGLAIHDAARVTADTKAVVVLKLTQVAVGGPA